MKNIEKFTKSVGLQNKIQWKIFEISNLTHNEKVSIDEGLVTQVMKKAKRRIKYF
jgi:hypothetical protein